MRLENQDIRSAAKTAGIPLWRIADAMNCSEPTITRKLRREMTDEEKTKFLSVIRQLQEVS